MTDFRRAVFKMVESIRTSDQLMTFMNKYDLTEEPEIQDRLLQLRYSEIAASEEPDSPLSPTALVQQSDGNGNVTYLELVKAQQSSNQDE